MTMQQSVVSKPSARIEALKARHKLLSERIDIEQHRPCISTIMLAELKREKLKLKEEIEGIKEAS